MRKVIGGRPQKRMLRNGNHDSTIRSDRVAHLLEREPIVINMLDYVKCPDHIELFTERKGSGV